MFGKPGFIGKFIIACSFLVFALFLFTVSAGNIYAQEFAQSERELEKQLEKTLKEAEELQKDLGQQRAKSSTLQGRVNVLSSEINKAQAVINEKSGTIKRLGSDIDLKEQTVGQLNSKLERSKETLSELLRATNQFDDVSLPEIVLSYDNISDFFEVVDTLKTIQNSMDQLFDQIRELRGLTEEEKITLEGKKADEADARAVVEREKQKVAVKKSEQDGLLAISKNVEKTYEQVLAEKRAKANAIRSALFKLKDSSEISFGDALKYANEASKATGVKASFILAIAGQESGFGKNIGTCNRTGDPESKKWYNIMPTWGDSNAWDRDDQGNYQKIVKSLGRPVDGTPLSCPQNGGWGGAMGPLQFIPTTWLLHASRVASFFDVKIADPWNPAHAFAATGFYVKDLGAAAGTYTAEKNAACKYYSGRSCDDRRPYNSFYGNQVMIRSAEMQTSIDFLKDVD